MGPRHKGEDDEGGAGEDDEGGAGEDDEGAVGEEDDRVGPVRPTADINGNQ